MIADSPTKLASTNMKNSKNNNKPAASINSAMSLLTPETIQKYDVSGPRYTSYPTADRFVEAFTDEAYIQTLNQRRVGGMALPLSMYVHIPFC